MASIDSGTVTVLFFGYLQARIGHPKVQSEARSLRALREEMAARFPVLGQAGYSVAVNGTVYPRDKELQPGDEVAFLPPFAGG